VNPLKKIVAFLLLILLSFGIHVHSIQASFRLNYTERTTVYIENVRHTKMVASLEYEGETSYQVINYMGTNLKDNSDLHVIVGDQFQAHGWGMGQMPAMIDRIHQRYDQYQVVGAVNGDFYNTTTGMPVEMHIRDFEVISEGITGYRPIIGFKDNGDVVHGRPCLQGYHVLVYDEDGALKRQLPVSRINRLPLGLNDISVYFDDFANVIPSDENKVVISATETKKDGYQTRYFGKGHMSEPTTNQRIDVTAATFVIVGHQFNNDNIITPYDRVVVQQKLGCGFEDVRFAIGAWEYLVKDGVPSKSIPEGAGVTFRHPRTAIGIKQDGTVFFVVVDGRNKPEGLWGVTGYEMAEIMKYFDAYTAYNLDGGGSSTFMMLNNEGGYDVHNTPSDGRFRSLSNALFIVKGSHAPVLDPLPYPDNRPMLEIPSFVHIDQQGVLRFGSVEHGVGYRVSINGVEYDTDVPFVPLNLPAGVYDIRVRAMGDRNTHKHSYYSEPYQLQVHTDEIREMLNLFRYYIKR
jgi:hypothetical protein